MGNPILQTWISWEKWPNGCVGSAIGNLYQIYEQGSLPLYQLFVWVLLSSRMSGSEEVLGPHLQVVTLHGSEQAILR